jgi:two-component system response regulator HydG
MEQGISIVEIPDEVFDIFNQYNWGGNVRELRNVVQRSVVIATQSGKDRIEKEFLPYELQRIKIDEINKIINIDEIVNSDTGLEEYLEKIEKKIIQKTLEESKNNKALASKKLKIPRATLYYKMDKYGISID